LRRASLQIHGGIVFFTLGDSEGFYISLDAAKCAHVDGVDVSREYLDVLWKTVPGIAIDE
jgi:hypothetical protein